MPFTPETLEEKPYNRCIVCPKIGVRCDGPNFLAMDIDRWCEWCRIRKEHLGWTNAYIAEMAQIAKVSVDRALSGNVKDMRISTMQAITKTLVNGTWGQYPCAAAADEIDGASTEACRRLQEELERTRSDDRVKIDYLVSQIAFKDSQLKNKDKLLDERADFLRMKDRTNRIQAVLLIICIFFLIAALVTDFINPDMGFFWRRAAMAAQMSLPW